MNKISAMRGYREFDEFKDDALLRILNPDDRTDRSEHINENNTRMPHKGDSQWRLETVAGHILPKSNNKGIVSNFFTFKNSAICETIFHYDVKIYQYRKLNPDSEIYYVEVDESLEQKADVALNYSLIHLLRKKVVSPKTWTPDEGYGIAYDGHSALFSTKQLFDPGSNDVERRPADCESTEFPKSVNRRNSDYGPGNSDAKPGGNYDAENLNKFPKSSELSRDFAFDLVPNESVKRLKFHIRLRQVALLSRPKNTERIAVIADSKVNKNDKQVNQSYVRALDVALLGFVRGQVDQNNPKWIMQGSKAFDSGGENIRLGSPNFLAMRGFSVSTKAVMGGLSLVCDMAVSCFIEGGELTQFICNHCNFRNFDEMKRNLPLHRDIVDALTKSLKGVKIKVKHLNHSKKFREFGPPAESEDSNFEHEDEHGNKSQINVAKYFELQASKHDNYSKLLPNKRLEYPGLPTVNVGSAKRKILIPVELILVPCGQNRHQLAPNIVSKVIKEAAVKPDVRMNWIANNNKMIEGITQDPDSQKFGLSEVETRAKCINSHILPPAKIQYRNNTLDPGLEGTWNIPGNAQFSEAPPMRDGEQVHKFAVLCASANRYIDDKQVEVFTKSLTKEASKLGVPSKLVASVPWCIGDNEKLEKILRDMFKDNVRMVLVVMTDDGGCYGAIKYQADFIGIATQCMKYKNVCKPPRGYAQNLMLKINTKMGGINHKLASRLERPESAPKTFQSPPVSISWVFDKPTMLVGMDISHPEPGENGSSMAAVVCSLDGSASQYAAHMSAQEKKDDINTSLLEAMTGLVATFKRKNGSCPEHVIVYRDGVSEGQYMTVLDEEIEKIRQAISLNSGDGKNVKVTFMSCSKRHSTRLVYNDGTEETPNYINPCSGVCVDATGQDSGDIVSSTLHEFYLNSHGAIQGTSKCTKYTLLYDQIGFKIAELELLTYWTTYLYCRCNKSVSVATPAYYARWASVRARLIASQCKPGEVSDRLRKISEQWSSETSTSTMYWI